MSDATILDQPDRLTLEIRYETAVPIGAAEFGVLIQELGKGFERYARGRRLNDLRLTLVGAGLGSHWIEVAVVSTGSIAATAIKYRKEIYDFADFLGKLFDIAKGLRGEGAKVADKKLIDAINAPVAKGQATQVNVTVFGGSPVITINQEIADTLWPTNPEDEANRLKIAGEAPSPAVDRPFKSPVLPALAGHFGTVIDVKGQWYVRLEGGEGVMNPAIPSSGVSLTDDQTYELYGSWEGRRYLIHRADPIGAPSKAR